MSKVVDFTLEEVFYKKTLILINQHNIQLLLVIFLYKSMFAQYNFLKKGIYVKNNAHGVLMFQNYI